MNDAHERFTGLYDQYYRRVLRYALQHADPGSAEDVASETFLIAWRRRAEISQPSLPWLLVVARNLLLQESGLASRQRRIADRIRAFTTDDDLKAWDAGEHVVTRAAALEALATLPDSDVEVLTLVTWHDLSVADAAAVVGCTPHAFTVRLHRARKRLTNALRLIDNPSEGRVPASHPGTAHSRSMPSARGAPVPGPGQVAAVAQWGHGAVTVASWPSPGLA